MAKNDTKLLIACLLCTIRVFFSVSMLIKFRFAIMLTSVGTIVETVSIPARWWWTVATTWLNWWDRHVLTWPSWMVVTLRSILLSCAVCRSVLVWARCAPCCMHCRMNIAGRTSSGVLMIVVSAYYGLAVTVILNSVISDIVLCLVLATKAA